LSKVTIVAVMSNCDFVAGGSLIALAASRLALRAAPDAAPSLERAALEGIGRDADQQAAWRRVLREAAATPNTKRTQLVRGVWE
jgi:hypothetical protein